MEAIALLRKMDNDDISLAKFREMRDDIIGHCPHAVHCGNDFSQ